LRKKKQLMLIGSVCLTVVLALTLVVACAGPTPEAVPEEKIHVLVGGSGPGGAFYPLACGLMTIINEHVPGVRATAIASGAKANVRLMLTGEMLMAQWYAFSGSAIYAGPTDIMDEAQPQIRWVAPAHGSWMFFTTLDPEIKTLYDMKGKKIAMGGPGSSDVPRCAIILEAIGMKQDVDYKGILLDGFEAGDAMIDGQVDVVFCFGGMSTPSVAEVDAIKDQYFISPPEEDLDVILDALDNAGYKQSTGTIPKEIYNGLNEDYDTLMSMCAWFTTKDADEELIYQITKALWENIEIMKAVHEAGSEYSLESIPVEGMDVPCHPGALRYYQEIGVLTEDPFKG
jgi:uncharacterized protein